MKSLSRKLLFVTGKGGVGKTTVSLALALLAAERGKKTLLVEVNSEEQVSQLLERPAVGYREIEMLPNLWGINVDPKNSFREYVLLQIKFKSLYRAVFENKYVQHFIEGAPGLADLMSIGKIHTLVDSYDLIIVDAPATGHGLGLLEIASVVSRSIPVGPLRKIADRIDDFLKDPAKTQVLLVSLPEEMPVVETIEMKERLKDNGFPLGPVFLNQIQKKVFTQTELADTKEALSEEKELLKIIEYLHARQSRSEEYSRTLKNEFKEEGVVLLPYIFAPRFGLDEAQALVTTLEKYDL